MTGRFISLDTYISTGASILGANMFAYCYNNSPNMIDVTGAIPNFLQEVVGLFDQWVMTPYGLLKYVAIVSAPATGGGSLIVEGVTP